MKLDIIGDVHGYAEKLKELLIKMGYKTNGNTFTHPEGRKVMFIGDYIDRGSEEEAVLDIVRAMVESKDAFALLGNHEYNAICYATEVNGEYLRKHTDKNYKQHKAFLDEYEFGSEKHIDAINWFKSLPLFLEFDGVRFVHASWVNKDINHLRTILTDSNTIKEETYQNLNNPEHPDYIAIETVLKGVEREIPDGFVWADKDGNERTATRINWFNHVDNPTYKNAALSIPDGVDLPDVPVLDYEGTYNDNELVFFGHYWMEGLPSRQNEKCACVDYSVAKGGHLVAYRYDGEKEILNENFVF